MGASTKDSAQGDSKSPRTSKRGKTDATSNPKSESKPEGSTNADAAKPLAPPPRPGQQNNNTGKTPDYFAAQANASLSLEPNPFEQSFGGGAPETPGGTKLPPVAALASPSSLLPGSAVTPFNWGGGSLRTGPLSPAMLSGPAGDYFSEGHHLRGGFPTPNESSLRTGLTPGGSGSMFPAPSPNSQAMFAHLASGGATPSTIDFHRTAMSAAAKRDQNGGHQQEGQQPQGVPTQQQPSNLAAQGSGVSNVNGAPVVKNEPKPASGPFDPHDNDAANGLFMLAQGRNGTQPADQYTTTSGAPSHAQVAAVPPQGMSTSPQMGHVNGVATQGHGLSEGSNDSDDSEPSKPATRGKKRSAATAGRKKTDDLMSKAPPSKKAKGMDGMPTMSPESDPEDDMKTNADGTRVKMTDEEKRKNFLERNRVAALKCRQRKKLWLANLQSKVEMFSSENDALTGQISQLREEVVNLKTLLLAHKDCPVTQQQGMHGGFMSQVVEPYGAQMNPYGMAAPMQGQQVMAGQGGQRRYS